MTTTTIPKQYASEPTRDREVALFIRNSDPESKRLWLYAARGPWSEAVPVARGGFRATRGGSVICEPEDCRFVLDQWGKAYDSENDRPDLCWGGEMLTAEAFLAWRNRGAT